MESTRGTLRFTQLNTSTCVEIMASNINRIKAEIRCGLYGYGDILVTCLVPSGNNLLASDALHISASGPGLVLEGALAKRAWFAQAWFDRASAAVIEY